MAKKPEAETEVVDFDLYYNSNGTIELKQRTPLGEIPLSQDQWNERRNKIRTHVKRFWFFGWRYLDIPVTVFSDKHDGLGKLIRVFGIVTKEGYIDHVRYHWSPESGVSKKKMRRWILEAMLRSDLLNK